MCDAFIVLPTAVQVNLNSVWSGMGLMENNLLGAQHETRLRVEELEDRCVQATYMHALIVCRCVNTHACNAIPQQIGLAVPFIGCSFSLVRCDGSCLSL